MELPFVNLTAPWLQRQLGWSNSRQSWLERLVAAVLVGAAGLAAWYGSRLSAVLQVVVWSLLLVAQAFVLRRGWLKLFGPVLWFDMVRMARRPLLLRMRLGYAALLTAVFSSIWLSWIFFRYDESGDLLAAASVPPREAAQLNVTLLAAFLGLQLLTVFLLTPAYVGGALVEEKERRTLEFLLATDLRNREIVLSMLLSRLASLLLVLAAGLPILALIQFMGGIDPGLLLAGFAACALTATGLAGLAILNSVYGRRSFDAIARTYLIAFAYLVLSGAAWLLLLFFPWLRMLAEFPSTGDWESPVTVADCVNWLSRGNIFVAAMQLVDGIQSNAPLDALVLELLGNYAWFQGIVFLGGTAWAIARLRAVVLGRAGSVSDWSTPVAYAPGSPLSRVWRWPMLWKEIVVEGRHRPGWLARLGIRLLVAASLLPAPILLGVFIYFYLAVGWEELCQALAIWVRIVSTGISCLLLLQVALRAAGSVTSEHGGQTFDILMTTPLDSTAILFAKWLGSVVRPRRAIPWLATVWAIAWLTGGLEWYAVPCLVLAWLVFAAFFAVLGLCFSVTSRSTLHATVRTLVAIVALCAGHWLVALLYIAAAEWWFGSTARVEDWAMPFHLCALTPPVTLDLLTFHADRHQPGKYLDYDWEVSVCMAGTGLVIWGGAAVILWMGLSRRFRRLTGRDPVGRPERHGPESSKS